jgi:hypothetical protein
MGGGSGTGGLGLEICPRCGERSVLDGECVLVVCSYPRWPFWAACLVMVGLPALAIAGVILFA